MCSANAEDTMSKRRIEVTRAEPVLLTPGEMVLG